jgi:hypothetical protein
VLFGTAPALACIAPAHAYTLRDAWPPPDAVDLPLNTPLAFQLEPLRPEITFTGVLFSTIMPLRNEATGELVPVTTRDIGSQTDGFFSFVPLKPLQPNTAYLVDVGDPPPQAGLPNEPAQTRWRFTTGVAVRRPLDLAGKIDFAYELGSDAVFDCANGPGICGPTCAATGMREVTKARVSLPAPFDGFAAQGMEGELKISEQVAPGSSEGVVSRAVTKPELGKTAEVVVTMPERPDGAAYLPCFDYTVTDVSGQSLTRGFCAEHAYPLPDELSGNISNGMDPLHAPRTSTACSLSGAPRGDARLLALAVAALLLSRRRRSRISP